MSKTKMWKHKKIILMLILIVLAFFASRIIVFAIQPTLTRQEALSGAAHGFVTPVDPTMTNFFNRNINGWSEFMEQVNIADRLGLPPPDSFVQQICSTNVDVDPADVADNLDEGILCNTDSTFPMCVVAVHAEGIADYPTLGTGAGSLGNPNINYIFSYAINNPQWSPAENLHYVPYLTGYDCDGNAGNFLIYDPTAGAMIIGAVDENDIESNYIPLQDCGNYQYIGVMFFFSDEDNFLEVEMDDIVEVGGAKIHYYVNEVSNFNWGWTAEWTGSSDDTGASDLLDDLLGDGGGGGNQPASDLLNNFGCAGCP